MKRYRGLGHVCNILKIFLLFLGGLGFDQLLRDLANRPARRIEQSLSIGWRLGAWSIVVGLLGIFALDFLSHVRPGDLTETRLFGYDFDLQTTSPAFFMGRYLVFAGIFGAVVTALGQNARGGWIGPAFLMVHLADVGCYYAFVVQQAPFCPQRLEVGDELDVQPLAYLPRRLTIDMANPAEVAQIPSERTRQVCRLLTVPRGGIDYSVRYASGVSSDAGRRGGADSGVSILSCRT